MAEIFSARDSRTWDAVALKRCVASAPNAKLVHDMFLREARIARALSHPHIVTTHDLIVDDDGNPVLVMELLDGATAGSIAPRLRRNDDAVRLTIELAGAAAQALDYVHRSSDPDTGRAGLVHRDVSPDNLFVTVDGVVKLLDFGLAKQLDDMGLTREGVLKGKAAYLAPEQLAREIVLDGRADQYALATSIYWLLGNVLPFERDSMAATFEAIERAPVLPLSNLEPRVTTAMDTVIERALHRNPEQRYPSCGAFIDALRAAALVRPAMGGGRDRLAALVRATSDDRLPTLLISNPLAAMPIETDPQASVTQPDLIAPIRDSDSDDNGTRTEPLSTAGPKLLPRPGALVRPDRLWNTDVPLSRGAGDERRPWGAIVMVASVLAAAALFLLGRGGDDPQPSQPVARDTATDAVPGAVVDRVADPAGDRAGIVMEKPVRITRRVKLEAPSHIEWRVGGELIGSGAIEARVPDGVGEIEARDTQRGVGTMMSVDTVVDYASLPRARVKIRVRPWAEVFLGEQSLGMTPVPLLQMVRGSYRLRLVKDGVEQVHTIEVDDQPLDLRYRFD